MCALRQELDKWSLLSEAFPLSLWRRNRACPTVHTPSALQCLLYGSVVFPKQCVGIS